MCAKVSYGQPGTLGYVLNTSTRDSFLVDTGSVFSVIPHTSTEPASGPKIVAADRTPITSWGMASVDTAAAGPYLHLVLPAGSGGYLDCGCRLSIEIQTSGGPNK